MSHGTVSTAARLVSSTPEELAGAASQAIETARAGISRVKSGQLAGHALLVEYDQVIAALLDAASMVSLVSKAHPDAKMRLAGETAEQDVIKIATEISLDVGVYRALLGVDLDDADPVARHWVGKQLLNFRRAGVDRDEATRQRVRELNEALVRVGQDFARNINSDTRSAKLPPEALAGLPEDWVRAHPPDSDGLSTVTTDYPDILPFLTYAQDAGAREQMLRLWRQCGDPANIDVLKRMLALRHELATLLGYPNWAAYITEDKMIGTEQAAAEFIAEASAAAQARTKRDYEVLLERKRVDDPAAEVVEQWDSRYLTERVQAEQYAFDAQAIRPYFEYGRVKRGLLALCERLFAVRFVPRPDQPVWHPEVEAYDVIDAGELLGRIYLDMHPRPDKFNHAAMFSLAGGVAGRKLPECALLCNFPRPGEQPALLEPADVRTFLHEFGHLLHHIFGGRQPWAATAGISTERDFVEAPSQLLEEWIRDPATLATFAVHHETGEPVPASLVEQMRAADEFGRGLWVSQQVFYSALSLELHRRDPATLDLAAVEREAQLAHTPYRPLEGGWIHLSFGHLEGYSATYYTYLWSLVIAKDLFTGFDPDALLEPAAASRYRETVLAAGGSAPAAELVRAFLGRDYTVDAYRRWLDSNASR